MPKNKVVEDLFATQCWLYKSITDPYQVFANIFDASGVQNLRVVIQKILEAAISNRIYQEKSPADVLLYKRYIDSLIRVAAIVKQKKASEIKISSHMLLADKHFYCGRLPGDEWDDFPRFLSKKEYRNPYSVFRKFFKYYTLDKWLTVWKDSIEGSLGNHEFRLGINEISVHIHLVKLIEAAHLIDVREVTHVNGSLKNSSY